MQLVAQYVACLPFLGDNTRFFSVGTPPGVKSAGVTGAVFAAAELTSDCLTSDLKHC